MNKLEKHDSRVARIEARNARVEADKSWETSWARRALLVLFTYLAVGFYLHAIAVPQPWLNALIPSLAFLLSTLTLPFFKEQWLKARRRTRLSLNKRIFLEKELADDLKEIKRTELRLAAGKEKLHKVKNLEKLLGLKK
ncbi:MAG: hypothetical protein V1817_04995 [Candidatus Micrarchaeota archaeon]